MLPPSLFSPNPSPLHLSSLTHNPSLSFQPSPLPPYPSLPCIVSPLPSFLVLCYVLNHNHCPSLFTHHSSFSPHPSPPHSLPLLIYYSFCSLFHLPQSSFPALFSLITSITLNLLSLLIYSLLSIPPALAPHLSPHIVPLSFSPPLAH